MKSHVAHVQKIYFGNSSFLPILIRKAWLCFNILVPVTLVAV